LSETTLSVAALAMLQKPSTAANTIEVRFMIAPLVCVFVPQPNFLDSRATYNASASAR
jgi:hypothetical protein